jgi:hypothetical protein
MQSIVVTNHRTTILPCRKGVGTARPHVQAIVRRKSCFHPGDFRIVDGVDESPQSVVVTNHLPTILPLPEGEGWGEISPKAGSRIEPLNRCDAPAYQTIRRPFSLSQRERAGVRESLSDADIRATVHGEGESFGREYHTVHAALTKRFMQENRLPFIKSRL